MRPKESSVSDFVMAEALESVGLISGRRTFRMEFKLFGPGGSPPNHFRKGLDTLLALSDRQQEVVAEWLVETESFVPEEAMSSPLVAASSLTPDTFTKSAEALLFILESWHLYGLTLPDIQRDLMLLGVRSDRIDRLGEFLQRLGPVSARAYEHYMREEFENAVLPTLKDIEVVCDLRPIFEDYAYPPPKTQAVRHTKILGFSQMVLAELTTEDSGGRRHRFAFQMTEDTLADLETALQRVRDQLDILKSKTRALIEHD